MTDDLTPLERIQLYERVGGPCLGGCERRARRKDGYCCRAHRRITHEGFRPRVHGLLCDLAQIDKERRSS